MLWITVGWIGLIGIALMALTLMSNTRLSQFSKQFEKRRLQHTDRRLGITTRAIDAIKAVKFCAWEDRFLRDIRAARDDECDELQQFRTIQFTNVSIGRINPILCAAATYLVMAGIGEELEPGRVYAILTVFQAMRLALIMIPLSLTYITAYSVAFGRIRRYLELPEYERISEPTDDTAVSVRGATLVWPTQVSAAVSPKAKVNRNQVAAEPEDAGSSDPRFALKQLDVSIGWGMKVAVVGSVGSGKSSLISGILGDMHIAQGEVRAQLADVGYVPQRPFVICGTVQENIVFGRPWNKERFDAAIHGSSMASDLAQLTDGKDTEIGERGVTLSGGQQQRLSIARALYGAPKLLVMDDPLAAVDGRVGYQIFARAVLGNCVDTDEVDECARRVQPDGRTVVMALNQFRFLHSFDHVIYMRNGCVESQGTPSQLLSGCAHFKDFVGGDIGGGEGAAASGPQQDSSSAEEEQPQERKQGGGLVDAEEHKQGAVDAQVYKAFVSGMGSCRVAIALALALFTYFAMGFCDLWLSMWVSKYPDDSSSGPNATNTTDETDVNTPFYASVYAAGSFVFLVSMIAAGVAIGNACVASSRTLHDSCITRIMRAPVAFFDSTPSGRVLSRLGADMSQVDNLLTMLTEALVTFSLTLLVLCIVIGIIAPPMFAVLGVAGVVYYFQVVAQDRTNQQVKRVSNDAMTPLLNVLGELGDSHGKLLVRVMGFGGLYERRFDTALDHFGEANLISTSLLNSCAYFSYILALVISSGTAFFLIRHGSVSAAQLGLALTYSFLLPYFLQMYALIWSMFNMSITSLERLLQCCSDTIPQEPDWHLPSDARLEHQEWPSCGAVSFRRAQLIYRPGLPPALDDCNLEIPGGSKVGVVGRTGAGKSSMFVLLFRLVDAASGQILLDSEDLSKIGLMTLRRKMAIIPQEPLLLEGTVRMNIDPFGEYDDEKIARALGRVGLSGRENDLPRQLSAGERQLLQMARTLLRDVRVVVMDEPTSNIDPKTDAVIQRVVREDFKHCTVITIAHRLDTVIDSDMMVVMEKGKVAESGPPHVLLQNARGMLSQMVEGQGTTRAAELKKKAMDMSVPRAARAHQMPRPSSAADGCGVQIEMTGKE
eukprot:TRINITY_DN9115_c2_g1_i2.p1 TRINITY_DN9115_c2_g1~~TRINITY_DN9115_c2_g1_i2.p1  ORF type:complete len:1113 (+),score=225.64 TRINITY_DN9115_c2_g1_i2:815-4153(+)